MICEEKIPTQLLLEVVAGPSVESPDLPPKSQPEEETRRMLAAEKQREYRRTHQAQIRETERKSKARHRDERLAKQKNPESRAKAASATRAYRFRNRDRLRALNRITNRAYYAAHKEKRKEQLKASAKRCRVRIAKGKREYRKRNGDKVRAYFRSYLPGWRAKQRIANPVFLLKDRLRSSLKRALKSQGLRKNVRTMATVGCTDEELRKHIESQFTGAMCWDRPETHSVDHYVPLDAFHLLDPEELKWACNWRNLRPLDPIENKQKSSKIPPVLPTWLPAHIAARVEARRE